MCKHFTYLLYNLFITFCLSYPNTPLMVSNEILPTKLPHNHDVTAFLAISLVLILFIGSFLAVSMAFSIAFAYSSTTSATTTNSINKEAIPTQVKNFILNQIVNKSKAAIVIGFVDPNGTRIFSFGNMSTAHNIPINENTFFNIASITTCS